MKKEANNYAFIDSQNLNLAVQDMGWRLDWQRFRVYMREKFGVTTAYMFLGYLEENQDLYRALQRAGYVLVFKPVVRNHKGEVKGNVDADLVLQVMIDYDEYDQAVIVSGDGDFYGLLKYLHGQDKLARLIVPNKYKYSVLLRRPPLSTKVITFLNDLRMRLEYKKHRSR